MGLNFFKIGKRYRTRQYFYDVIDIDKKKNKIKIRRSDGQALWDDDPELLEKIHRAIQLEENTIRLICHHEECWNRDQRIIGFHRKAQWDILKANNKIIYFRFGENHIKGVFKIIKKGINLNPNFSEIPGISEPLIHQCRLELISDDIICDNPMEEVTLSFHEKWERERWGGLQTQVFPAEREDLKLILRDTTVVKFED